jgi:hypothetical protein
LHHVDIVSESALNTLCEQEAACGIVFRGRSAEHEVSLQSAKNVIDAIDRKYNEAC